MEKESNQQCNKRKYFFLGGAFIAIGMTFYYLRTPSGKKTIEKAKECTNKTIDGIKFVKDHRSEIFTSIKEVTNEWSTNVTEMTDEIKAISRSAKNVKRNAEQLWNKTSESIDEMKHLKDES